MTACALHRGIASDLLLNDVKPDLAEGEAMDFEHGSLYYPLDAAVRAASLEEMSEETDVIVLAAGRGGGPEETRLDLLRDNAALARDVGRRLADFEGVVVVVTNPVDVLTQVVTEASALPSTQVIGTGTLLDTARLRYELAQRLQLHPASIHAQVVGEHGDSEVCLWSSAQVAGRNLRTQSDWAADDETEIGTRVRRAAYEIIRRKGATNHAIGAVTGALISAILGDERRVLTVSAVHQGALGMHDVALSLPTVIGRSGVQAVLEPSLDKDEEELLERSASVLREAFLESASQRKRRSPEAPTP